MNIALVFAGGVGSRMRSGEIPKQFLEIGGKPILVHTLERFETHPQIDGICLVCVKEWMDHAAELLKAYNLKKVRWLVPGGASALDSQYNGLKALKENLTDEGNHCVLLHDGVRPLINEKLIGDCIAAVHAYGAAVTVAPAIETIIKTNGEGQVATTIERSECMLARAPQAFYLNQIIDMHEQAIALGKHDFIDSVSMALYFGKHIQTVVGPAENIKVTTPADFYTCRALLENTERIDVSTSCAKGVL